MENDQFCALTRIIGNIKFNNTSYEWEWVGLCGDGGNGFVGLERAYTQK